MLNFKKEQSLALTSNFEELVQSAPKNLSLNKC